MMGCVFTDRSTAGRALADAVASLLLDQPQMDRPAVFALPRGGVPVGLEIARRIRAPLDLVLVRKIGVPTQPELAAAAVVDGDDPQIVVNHEVVRAVGLSEQELERLKARELAEIERRRGVWMAGRKPLSAAGRDAIVVDDGVATGATMKAALAGLRRKGPRSLILAVPVAPEAEMARLRGQVDHAICLLTPPQFYAIGAYYDDFRQLSDEDVTRMMGEAGQMSCPENGEVRPAEEDTPR